jgi:quercetin dioxygenase-like cupin family protein
MEKENLKARSSILKEKKLHNEPMLTFDLPILIEKMKHKQAWAKKELNTIFLLKTPEKQIVLAALHEGTKINSFKPYNSITFQIIEGKLKFHTNKESVTLNKGQLLTLNENIKYSFTSNEESVFLITIAIGK